VKAKIKKNPGNFSGFQTSLPDSPLCKKNFKELKSSAGLSLAEREGFEPPEPLSSTVFKTAAIDHSAISPLGGTKVEQFSVFQKTFTQNNIVKKKSQ
jgi:hypothetical protein